MVAVSVDLWILRDGKDKSDLFSFILGAVAHGCGLGRLRTYRLIAGGKVAFYLLTFVFGSTQLQVFVGCGLRG